FQLVFGAPGPGLLQGVRLGTLDSNARRLLGLSFGFFGFPGLLLLLDIRIRTFEERSWLGLGGVFIAVLVVCHGSISSVGSPTAPRRAFDTSYRAGLSADPAAPRELAQQIVASNRPLGVLLLALLHEVGDVVVLVGVLDESVVDLAGFERVVLDADEVVDDVVRGSMLACHPASPGRPELLCPMIGIPRQHTGHERHLFL